MDTVSFRVTAVVTCKARSVNKGMFQLRVQAVINTGVSGSRGQLHQKYSVSYRHVSPRLEQSKANINNTVPSGCASWDC